MSKASKGKKTQSMRGRDFLSVDDFSPREIKRVFELAASMKAHPCDGRPGMIRSWSSGAETMARVWFLRQRTATAGRVR